MNTYELILRRRTIRKFSRRKIEKHALLACVNAARLTPSSANLQPLEYVLVTSDLDKVFEHTHWAGYLEDGAPKKGEEPTAYIVVISNTKISKDNKYDVGLAVANIILAGLERGIASCTIGSLNRSQLIKNLAIPENYVVELVVALGYPKQVSVEDEFKGDVKYWLDEKGTLHVPKRKLEDILHYEIF